MTYGPVVIPGSAYVDVAPNMAGVFGETVRVLSDPVQIQVINELSAAYYGAWKQDVSYQYGDWNRVPGNFVATADRFNQLQHLVSTMGRVGFHFVNVFLGYPVSEDDYRYVDTTYRYRVASDPSVNVGDLDFTNDGVALGPVTRADLLPAWLADLDRMETLLGQSTRSIRDYYISLFFAQTGVDLAGVF